MQNSCLSNYHSKAQNTHFMVTSSDGQNNTLLISASLDKAITLISGHGAFLNEQNTGVFPNATQWNYSIVLVIYLVKTIGKIQIHFLSLLLHLITHLENI